MVEQVAGGVRTGSVHRVVGNIGARAGEGGRAVVLYVSLLRLCKTNTF